jgi:DHA1 family tetracycline resistance protein-like MFS transporter
MFHVPSLAGRRPAALGFIFVTVLLDLLAFGIVIPVLPRIVQSLLAGNTMRAALVLGIFSTAWAAMQFVFSPLLGALSDAFGRRPVILISLLGLGLDYMVIALAPSLAWLFVGRILSGITAASFTTASAYIADVTAPEQRAAGYGMLGAAFGLGFVLGPALGGVLGSIEPRLPFWVAATLCLLNAAYGAFVLPESLPRAQRVPLTIARANPFGALSLLRARRGLSGVAAVAFLFYLANEVLPAVFVLYAGFRYGWSEIEVGAALALMGVAGVIVQGGLTGPVIRRLGERRTLFIGLALGAAGFATYGLARSGPMFLLGIPLMALWGLAGPAAQSIMTQSVAASEQGRLQGALNAVRGVSGLIGPGLFALLFAASIHTGSGWQYPGAAFLLAAALLAAASFFAWSVTRRNREAELAK